MSHSREEEKIEQYKSTIEGLKLLEKELEQSLKRVRYIISSLEGGD